MRRKIIGTFIPKKVRATTAFVIKVLLPNLTESVRENFLNLVEQNVNIKNIPTSSVVLDQEVVIKFFPRDQNENNQGKGPWLEIENADLRKAIENLSEADLRIILSTKQNILFVYFEKEFHSA